MILGAPIQDVEHKRNLMPADRELRFGCPGARLESDVGPEVYQELLAAFLAHLSLQVVELNTAVANEDVARGAMMWPTR